MGRALVIHPGALGDVLLALPALGHLGHLGGGLHRTLAAAPRSVTLLEGAGCVDATVDFDRLALHHLFSAEPDPAVLRALARYDVIVSWLGAGDATYTTHLAGLGRPVVVARSVPPTGGARHASWHLLDTLVPLGPLPAALPVARLAAGETERAWAHEWLAAHNLAPAEAVVIHPGAGRPAKVWPGFPALARRLLAGGIPVVAVTGPAEVDAAAWLAAESGGALRLARDLPIRRLAGLLAAARGFVGNDSGPTHLAAALGCPTIGLFGPTDPAVWAPVGPRVTVLAGAGGGLRDPWDGLGVAAVTAAVKAWPAGVAVGAGRGMSD